MKKPGGLALVIAEKMNGKGMEHEGEGDDESPLPDGKEAAVEEFGAAMSAGDNAAAAKALQSFVSMCRYDKEEE